jgi:hypothetical protein
VKIIILFLVLGGLALHAADTTVQVDVRSILNTRVVTTLSSGKVVPFRDGVDAGSGLMTRAAAKALGLATDHTLPNNGKFPATADRPAVVLNYSDADGEGNQVRRSVGEDVYKFQVPPAKYAKMLLFFTSAAAGPAKLRLVLTYTDGLTEGRDIVCPDYWNNLDAANNPAHDIVYVAFDQAKFDPQNKMLEKSHHNIFGIDIHPTPGKVLTAIEVHKTTPIVCFWGATGMKAN